MREKLVELEKLILADIEKVSDISGLDNVRVKYLGRNGELTNILRELGKLPSEERPLIGKLTNDLKIKAQNIIDEKLNLLKESGRQKSIKEASIDITLSGRRRPLGHLHPLTQVMYEIEDIFLKLGFEIVEGPEVELDYYNFEALNFPKDHPARDMHDTFYITDNIILRTHTSPVQVRVMEKRSPPLQVIAPGRVYRCDADVSHSPMFHQVEGFMVDKKISFGDLKGVLSLFARKMFGSETKVRFRPSYFPFTEPSVEIDIECRLCRGKGCRVCKESGWLEILGAGMIDPAVFKAVKYDPEKYSGFAFGMGVERIAMLKFGIDDIRLFFENNILFLEQF
ncbi:MAG: phenylalanine--tRNA ligase subunit alpha [bacterium]